MTFLNINRQFFRLTGTIGSHLNDEYNQYSFFHRKPLSPRPLDAMADLTNDLGVCVLRVCRYIDNRDGTLAGLKLKKIILSSKF